MKIWKYRQICARLSCGRVKSALLHHSFLYLINAVPIIKTSKNFYPKGVRRKKMRKILLCLLGAVMLIVTGCDDMLNSIFNNEEEVVEETVESPVFSVAAGTYSESQTLEITSNSSSSNVTIIYTTDGSTPSTSNGSVYTHSIAVTESMTVKAIVVIDSKVSSVTTVSYIITETNANVRITVLDPRLPTITVTSSVATFMLGSDFTLTASASPEPDSYAWYIDGVVISGETSSTLTYGSSLNSGNHVITLITEDSDILNSVNIITSTESNANVEITVLDPRLPTISVTSSGTEVALGSDFTLTASVTPEPDSYAWYIDGVVISGETTSTLTYGSSLAAGNHVITLITEDSDILNSESFEFEVVSETGTVSGAVIDSTDYSAVSAVTVTVYSGTTVVKSASTDSDGEYSISVPEESDYTVEFTKTGYIDAEYYDVAVTVDETTYLATILYVSSSYSGTGIISGTITNAFDGNGVSSATINFYSGLNITPDSSSSVVGTVTTDSSGDYTIDSLSAGYYTAYVTKTDYIAAGFNVIVIGSDTVSDQNFSISPNISSSEIRIVLTWGSTPYDLDSHLATPDSDHVYYADKGSETSAPYAKLDVDDMYSYGPETITIYTQQTGTYTYYVHDYSHCASSNSTALANSSATVKVYMGGVAAATYNVPTEEGTLWKVFELSGTTLTPVNSMLYELYPYRVDQRTLNTVNTNELDFFINLPQKAGGIK